MVVIVEEMKNYLRVDFEDDDVLLSGIITQAQQICMDVQKELLEMEKIEKFDTGRRNIKSKLTELFHFYVLRKSK